MNYRIKTTMVLLSICILSVFLLTSCKKEEPAVNVPTFKADTVFKVNGEEVSLGEWNLYAQPVKAGIDKLYGKEIWDYKMDAEGKLFGESLKENIRNRIVTVKLIASKAEELGVKLTEDDKSEIAISADEYLEILQGSLKDKYGITEDIVEKVYSDNLLATKVYEHLTLNVSTETEETEVRHMVLQYMMYPKSYETREGDTVLRTTEEVTKKRNELESIKQRITDNPKLTLKDCETEELTASELIADLAELKNRLPEHEAGVVFWLRAYEMSPLIETDEALIIFQCIKIKDEESTNAARVKVIEEREQQVFGTAYAEWKKDVNVETNKEIWDTLD